MPDLLNYEELEEEINRLAGIIGASGCEELPTYRVSQDFARPHIEIDDSGYHFVIVERGNEFRRSTMVNLDDLLYMVFEGVAFSMATDYELKHRIGGKDSRELLFQKQVELLSELSPAWAEKCQNEHDEILKKHPLRNF